MNFINELSTLLSGGASAAHIVAAFIFMLFGAITNILYDVQTRNVTSIDTPVTWDWKFFWKDNRLRFGLNLLIAMAVARFLYDFTGIEPKMAAYYFIGAGFDVMFVIFKKLKKRITDIINKYLDVN